MYSSYLLFNPASIPDFFKQAWRNKFAFGSEDLCQVFHPKCVLIGSLLKLSKRRYLMKTNRCKTAECHCEIVNVSSPRSNSKTKKKKSRVMTGKDGCYRSPVSQTKSSEKRGAPTHRPSRHPCQHLRSCSPTQLPHVDWSHLPSHPMVPSCPPKGHPHHISCRAGHFSAHSTENP